MGEGRTTKKSSNWEIRIRNEYDDEWHPFLKVGGTKLHTEIQSLLAFVRDSDCAIPKREYAAFEVETTIVETRREW